MDQSGPSSNGNEGVLYTSQASELETHYQIQFSVIPFWEGLTPQQGIYSGLQIIYIK